MKKTFQLTDSRHKAARLPELAKRDINRYIRRERKRALPKGVDFWDFACKFGPSEELAETVHLSAFSKCIDAVVEQQLSSFYVEIVAIPGRRTKKPKQEKNDEAAASDD